MDIFKMLDELRSEQQQIQESILALERLAVGTGSKRRGRPPKWMTASGTDAAAAAPRKKRTMSAAIRKKMAEAQKRRWAAKKAAAKQTP